MGEYHIPVLLKETIFYLDIKPGEKYIDCTLGGAGHTKAILEAGGIVLGIDQDNEAIEHVGQLKNLTVRQGDFAHLKNIALEAGFSKVAGILFDLGVSSHQLDTDYRGFSFNTNAPLDMRKDQKGQSVTAADLINAGSETELANLFWKFGEERDSRRIAKGIVEARKIKKIETTDELSNIILTVSKRTAGDRTHPATRVFQALRIAVNDELNGLEMGLVDALDLLDSGGRLAVISFHSLEDRIVKNFIKIHTDLLRIITDKPVTASEREVQKNPRARSGKLRVAEKI